MRENKTQSGQNESGGQQMERSSRQQPMRRSSMFDPFEPHSGLFADNPFSLMRQMQQEMDRVFAQAFGGLGGAYSPAGSAGGGMSMWSPAIEVTEREGALRVCAELPGLKPEDVKVEVTNEELIIQGERQSEQESKEAGFRRSERRYGKFYRAIPLPEGVDAGNVKAKFNDGVLDITIPVPEQHNRRKQVRVESGAGGQHQATAQTGTQTQTGTQSSRGGGI